PASIRALVGSGFPGRLGATSTRRLDPAGRAVNAAEDGPRARPGSLRKTACGAARGIATDLHSTANSIRLCAVCRTPTVAPSAETLSTVRVNLAVERGKRAALSARPYCWRTLEVGHRRT